MSLSPLARALLRIAAVFTVGAILAMALVPPPALQVTRVSAEHILPVASVQQRPLAPTYPANAWVHFFHAVSLDGVLTRCDEKGLLKQQTHNRITKRMMAVLSTLAASPENMHYQRIIHGVFQQAAGEGVLLSIVPDASDGGVKLGEPTAVNDAASCKEAQKKAIALMAPGGILDVEGAPDDADKGI